MTQTDYKEQAELWEAKFNLLKAMYDKAAEHNAQVVADLKKEKRTLNLRITMLVRKVEKLTQENKKLDKQVRELVKTNQVMHYELYGKPRRD